MSRVKDAEIGELLDEAEAAGRYLHVPPGSTRRALDRRASEGKLARPARGWYARIAYRDGLNRKEHEMHMLHTAAQQHPSWIFCNATAALAHGLYASYWRVRPPHILVQRGAGGGPTGAARRHEGAADDVEVVGSLRVTSLRRTAVDCMRTLCPEEALAIADSTLRKTGATNEELSEWVKRYGAGKKGVNNAMEAALLANPLSENGGESMARSIMIRSGFVPPQLQVPFDNPAGGEPYRVDFYWLREDGRIVVGEFDGKEKYVEEGMTGGKDIVDVVLREKERESIVSDFNVRVFRFTFQDIMHPERLVQKMVQAGVPRLWWRA